MGDIGYRRKGDNTPLYHPERDYAYITPTLMRIAIETLDANEPPERATWRREHGITVGEVAQIAEALAKAQSDFVNAVDPVSNFQDALERHGFFTFSYDTRQYLFAAIGEVFCAAWFKAVRDVSVIGEESPAAADMAKFSASVREFVSKAGLPTRDVQYIADYRQMQNRAIQAKMLLQQKELDNTRSEYYRLLAEFNAMKAAKKTQVAKSGFFGFLRSFFGRARNAEV